MPKKEKTVTIIQPSYYAQFSCIGPDCTDNCCHDWTVTIDKKHYLQYMGVPDHAFHEKCKRAILRNKKNKSDADYAIMLLNSGRCLFQDPDGGCGIFRKLGQDALSDTCTIYPRLQRAVGSDTTWERSLTLSCQEAARLALLTGQPLQFERVTASIAPDDRLGSMYTHAAMKESDPHYASLQAMRKASIEIMRLHDVPLRDRILSVGLSLRAADRYLHENKEDRLPALLDQCVAQAAEVHGTGRGSMFDRMPYDPVTHRWAILLPAKHLMTTERAVEKLEMMQVIGGYCENLGGGRFEIGPAALDFMRDKARETGDPFLKRYTQAAENYLVNYIFSSLFPFTYVGEQCSPAYHAVILAEQYAMLRILLGVMPPREGEDDDARFIRLIAVLAHITQHRNLGRDVKAHASQKEGLDTLAYAAYMLR